MTIAKSPYNLSKTSERFAVYEPTLDEIEVALASSVSRALPSASLGLGIMYTLLSVSHGLLLPPEQRNILLPIAIVSALFFLIFYFTGGSRNVASGHTLAGIFGLVALVNSAVHLAISGDPLQSSNIILVMLGVSAFFLSTRWFTIVVGASFVSWIAVAASNTLDDTWIHFGIALAMALLTSVIIHRVRVRAYVNLHQLRLQYNRQVTQLEDARELLQVRVQRRTEELQTVSGSLSKERTRREVQEVVLQGQAADIEREKAQLESKYASQLERLQADKTALTATDKLRSETVAKLTDELISPLQMAQNNLDVLSKMLMVETSSRQASMFKRVSDALDRAKESAEKLRAVPKLRSSPKAQGATSIDKVVASVMSAIESRARLQKIELEAAIDPPISTVNIESTQLRLSLMTLFNTIFERTIAGEKTGLLVRGDLVNKQAKFMVWSTGRAMLDAEKQAFFEGDKGKSKHELQLTKRLIEKSGGSLELLSGKTNGIIFAVKLPWTPSSAERKQPDTPTVRKQLPPHIEQLLREHKI